MKRGLKFVISVLVDFVGWTSYAIPIVGELSDAVVAPLTAAWIWYAYKTPLYSIIGFAEEILPATDIIPTATIAHFMTRKQ